MVQQIFAHNLDRDIAADLFEIVRNDPKIITNVYQERRVVYEPPSSGRDALLQGRRCLTTSCMSRANWIRRGSAKVFFTCEDHEHLLPLEQAMNARWGDRVERQLLHLNLPGSHGGWGYQRGMRWRRWRRCSATLFPIASPSATV